MMKVLKYSVLVFFGFIWYLGCSKEKVIKLANKGLIKDDFRYGDLYRLSNLPQYKGGVEHCEYQYPGQKVPINLYLAGDSFSEEGRMDEATFASKSYERSYIIMHNDSLRLKPGKNILLIETVERHLRERFSGGTFKDWVFPTPKKQEEEKPFFQGIYQKFLALEVPFKEELLESVLFSYDWALWFREKKAWINYKVFHKVDPKVKIVNGEIVYYLDVDPGVSSVYDVIDDAEIQTLVQNINQTREDYKAMGFDEVYISIIPNKTSVLVKDDAQYNRLLERVENHPDLITPVISTWKEFTSGNYYLNSDSHWTCEGQQIWVDKVNHMLTQEI